jgi:hypothetical protein
VIGPYWLNMTAEEDIPCEPRISDAGFPHRTVAILERERNLYPLMAALLTGGGKDEPAEPSTVTTRMIERAFTTRDGGALRAAAYFAGRCRPAGAANTGRLTLLLRSFIASLQPTDLGPWEVEYIESAMSLALRGDAEAGLSALAVALPVDHQGTGFAYLAAFYLAQLGDPSRYPVILRSLRSDNEHTRLMAVRHLVAFQPYDGQDVGGTVVDIRTELVARLSDHDPYVRVEVPYYLAEAGISGLKELLEPVAAHDPDPGVRTAAAEVLRRSVS